MNDFLGKVHMHNAVTYQMDKNYVVKARFDNGTVVEVGTATADKEVLTFKAKVPLCMNRVKELTYTVVTANE